MRSDGSLVGYIDLIGGSAISEMEEAVGAPTYYLAKCFPKLHENERNWTEGASLDPWIHQ